MPFGIGSGELFIILVIMIMLFGSKKVTEAAKQMGQAGKELEKAKGELDQTVTDLKNQEKEAHTKTETSKSQKGGEES